LLLAGFSDIIKVIIKMAIFGELWNSVPPITRTILLISILLTGAVSLDLCTPFKLYFNYNLIKRKYQVRL
jgi:Der1-like family